MESLRLAMLPGLLGGSDSPEDPLQAEVSERFASVNSFIFTTVLLALIFVGYHINTHRLKHVPESCAAVLLGFLVALAVRLMGLKQEELILNFQGGFFFFVLLPPIIFEAGLSLDCQMFVDNLGAILAFAVVGTIISTWVVASSLVFAASTGWFGLEMTPDIEILCYMFGALISATDPVATIALFGGSRFNTDPLLHALINGESVLNDAVAVVLFSTISHLFGQSHPTIVSPMILVQFFLVSLGSLVVGLLAGAACSFCFRKSSQLHRFPDYEISIMCLGAYATFAVSQLVGLSGIVSLFFFGIVLAQYNWYNLSEPSKVASRVTFGTLAKLAEAVCFLYLGAVAALSIGKFHWNLPLVLFTLVSITVARAVHVFPLAVILNFGRIRKISPNMMIAMFASGLRGAIAFALSLHIPCENQDDNRGSPGCQNSDLLVTSTISVVIVTTLVVGTAMEKIAMALQVIEPATAPSAENSPGAFSPHGPLAVPLAGLGPRRSSSFVMPDKNSEGQDTGTEFSSTETDESNGSTGSWSRDVAPPSETRATTFSRTAQMVMRFNARGRLYQAFARVDLEYLQPVLGGPANSPAPVTTESASGVEMHAPPNVQDFIQSGMGMNPRAITSVQQQGDDDAPPWSRSVVFE